MLFEYDINGEELLGEIRRVKDCWDVLNCRLNWVNDVRSIEQISYEMLAYEKRYNYLLKLAKENNLHSEKLNLREGL